MSPRGKVAMNVISSVVQSGHKFDELLSGKRPNCWKVENCRRN